MAARYCEMVIEGPRGWALGFVLGFLAGRGSRQRLLDAEEAGFDCEPFREQIRELLHSSDILHLLAPRSQARLVRRAVRDAARLGRPMVIRHERPLQGARFEFSFAIYSREHARRIRRLFERLKAGLRLAQGTEIEEIQDPGARGVEMYAPVHDYELRGRGAVEGDIEALLALHAICRREELIQAGDLHLLAARNAPRRRTTRRRKPTSGGT